MKWTSLLLIFMLGLFVSCEEEEEEEDVYSCSFSQQTVYNLSGVDISQDFSETNVPREYLVTRSSCEGVTQGQSGSDSVEGVSRSSNSLTITVDGESESLQILNEAFSYPAETGNIQDCSITISAEGELDGQEEEIVIQASMSFKGDDCKDLEIETSFL